MFTISICFDVKHSKKFFWDRVIRVFPTGGQGQSPQLHKNFPIPTTQKKSPLSRPLPKKFLYPPPNVNLPLNNNFHVITPIETSFLVFYNFILSVNPSHANFDFNVMSNIYRMLLLALKKLRENSTHPLQHFKNPGHVVCYLFLCAANADFVMVHSILKLRDNLEQRVFKKFSRGKLGRKDSKC